MGRVGQLGEGEQMGSVYKQPEREVDDSYHNWRVPSKWKGTQGGAKGSWQGEQGELRHVYMQLWRVCKNDRTIRMNAIAYITMNECRNNMLSCI